MHILTLTMTLTLHFTLLRNAVLHNLVDASGVLLVRSCHSLSDEDADTSSETESTNNYEGSNTDSERGVCEGEEEDRGDGVEFGETVVCGSDDDPL